MMVNTLAKLAYIAVMLVNSPLSKTEKQESKTDLLLSNAVNLENKKDLLVNTTAMLGCTLDCLDCSPDSVESSLGWKESSWVMMGCNLVKLESNLGLSENNSDW
jgi:hypothetical protein